MADGVQRNVFAIAAQHGFADTLAEYLLSRYSDPEFGLARLTLLIPNGRAGRAFTEALIRKAGNGLLLPRQVVIGDLDLGERLGNLLDPIGSAAAIAPAVDPMQRRILLARLIHEQTQTGGEVRDAAEAFRLADEFARVSDQLIVQEKSLRDLIDLPVEPELADHWRSALDLFRRVSEAWQAQLGELGLIEAAERRNQLLRRAANQWRQKPAETPIVAAGITTSAPAVCSVLRSVASLPMGAVVIPGFDPGVDDAVWDALGSVGLDREAPDAQSPNASHPLYHIKQVLEGMGVNPAELQSLAPARVSKRASERAELSSAMFLPAKLSDRWFEIGRRGLAAGGIKLFEAANQDEEAQLIALIARQALDTPGKRIAIVTPDRMISARVIAHMRRWGLEVDDSAGTPLAQTAAGKLILAVAQCAASNFAPVDLLGLLKHPLVMQGDERLDWLDSVRQLDLLLRGPRPAPGLQGLDRLITEKHQKKAVSPDLLQWWKETRALLEPLSALRGSPVSLARSVSIISETAALLSRDSVWQGPAGRLAADGVQGLVEHGEAAISLTVSADQAVRILSQIFAETPVRQPFGTHPRLAIYGLLEARLQTADLVICAGLNEGVWPALPTPDPWLAPMVRRALGLPSLDERIGLSAQDLAGLFAAPEVVLTRALRDGSAPTIASRFLLRLKALVDAGRLQDQAMLRLAGQLDQQLPYQPTGRPTPKPSAEQRKVPVSATELDRLRADPFAFYARKILGLFPIDAVDAEPSHAWRGTAVHSILEEWGRHDLRDPQRLIERATAFLDSANVHPVIIALWRPRLLKGLEWVAEQTASLAEGGRVPVKAEASGGIDVDGIRISGKADRIDACGDGSLAIVDYKTGTMPSPAQVEAGFALQLGLLGLIAQRDGFEGLSGPVSAFEYWSLAKSKNSPTGFGEIKTPILGGRRRRGVALENMVPVSEAFLRDAIARWLNGKDGFTAKLNPDFAVYADYDQLMRLEEWYGRDEGRA